MNKAERSPRPDREQRRSDILSAARELFCSKGYEHTAVSEIGALVGVVEGTVYRYFDSKHALLIAVLQEWYAQMFADYADALSGVSGARARVRLLIWRHLRTIRDAPELCRLMFREARDDISPANQILRELNRRYTRFLIDELNAGIAQGMFRAGVAGPVFRDLIYGGIEHYCWRYLIGQSPLDIEQAADDISSLFFDGIAVAPSAASLQQETQRLSSLIADLAQRLPALSTPHAG